MTSEEYIMSQHPENRSEKSKSKSKSTKTGNLGSGHSNAHQSGRNGGATTHGRN